MRGEGAEALAKEFLDLEFLNCSLLSEGVLEWAEARDAHLLGLAEHRLDPDKLAKAIKRLQRSKDPLPPTLGARLVAE